MFPAHVTHLLHSPTVLRPQESDLLSSDHRFGFGNITVFIPSLFDSLRFFFYFGSWLAAAGNTVDLKREGEAFPPKLGEIMITRSKLVDQLRDYQIRSQSKLDVIGALSWGVLSCLLVIASYVILYFRYHRLSAAIVFLGILILICAHIRQRELARKRDRRLLLPLSM